MTVSRAGDWTAELIDNPPGHVWVRGIPTVGVINVKKLFSKVVIVATGSGIGPALGHLLAAETPSQLVWATRDPTETYGAALVDEILTAQPDAIIWDTDELGQARHAPPGLPGLHHLRRGSRDLHLEQDSSPGKSSTASSSAGSPRSARSGTRNP